MMDIKIGGYSGCFLGMQDIAAGRLPGNDPSWLGPGALAEPSWYSAVAGGSGKPGCALCLLI